jgi:transposase
METSQVASRIGTILPILNERQKRIFLASEAIALGYGGVTEVSKISGVSRVTITKGMNEIKEGVDISDVSIRCRKKGGGRKKIIDKNPKILSVLEQMLEPYTSGDPINELLWTSKSTRNLEKTLNGLGIIISDTTIASCLRTLGYSLQMNKKALTTRPSDPERDNQFRYIANLYSSFRG